MLFKSSWDAWLYFYAAVQGANFICFIFGYFIFTISIIDVCWGLLPLIPMNMLFIERLVLCGVASISTTMWIVYSLVTIWGLRLTIHLAVRYQGEDDRYVELKKLDAKCPEPFKAFMAWLRNFFMQGTASIFVQGSILKIFQESRATDSIGALEICGVVLWVVGISFEIIGDHQLTQFVKIKKPGQVIDIGLWRYTRHPNYFGESLLWYAYYLMACGGSVGPNFGYYTFYSPLVMHFFLRYVTGVLILEAKQKRKPAFRVYMKETSIWFPLPPTKFSEEEKAKMLEQAIIECKEDVEAEKGSILYGIVKKDHRKYLYKGGADWEGKDDKMIAEGGDIERVAPDTDRSQQRDNLSASTNMVKAL